LNSYLIFCFLAFSITFLLTALVRHYALKKSIVDLPNHRTLHDTPTPRGGGLAITATYLGLLVIVFIMGKINLQVFMAVFGGGLIIALGGLLDDLKVINGLRPRLAIQLAAAIWALYWLREFPHVDIGPFDLYLGGFGYFVAILGIIWVTNLYNFMDGIDGLAGTQAVSVCAFAGFFLWQRGFGNGALFCWGLAAASLGFLVWNWPRAKIFMGDVGSTFLGFTIAVLAVRAENYHSISLLIVAILMGVFIVDATATLLCRVVKNERWFEAHCMHAYQRAVQLGWSHRRVTLSVLAINIILGGIAYLAVLYPDYLLFCFAGSYAGLILLYLWIGAKYGRRKKSN
jgi:Fuc2NAc and GlcNAc transferase